MPHKISHMIRAYRISPTLHRGSAAIASTHPHQRCALFSWMFALFSTLIPAWITAGLMALGLSGCLSDWVPGQGFVQSDSSSKARLKLAVKGNQMTVTLTNRTNETVVIDGEMELWFSFHFIGCDNMTRDSHSIERGKPLSARLVQLAPGESYTKVFKSGDVHHSYTIGSYSTADGGGGWFESMSSYRIPEFSNLRGINILYSSHNTDYPIPCILARKENIASPDNLLDTVVSVEVSL